MRWRVRIGYPVAVLYWLLATPTRHWIAIGVTFLGCSSSSGGGAGGADNCGKVAPCGGNIVGTWKRHTSYP